MGLSNAQILIVDDDERILQTLARNLRAEGYAVATSLDSRLALQMYESQPFDIVIADVRMPQMDGFALLAAVRQHNPEAEVILMTGHGDVEMAIGALRAGASDFIPKPVETATLQAALRRACEQLELRRALHAAQQALQEERELLAQRVAERTAELSAANAELSRAARLKDEFLASMSHELRTPLNAILGMAEVMRRELYGPLNDKQKKYIGTIEDSGRHLLNLINDILDLSKIEAGKFVLEVTATPVAAVCQDSVWLVGALAQQKKLDIAMTLDENVDLIAADRRRLKQILVNLLSNAIKFTPENGKIGLEVAGDAEQRVVHLTVWDTGIGIPAQDMDRLFRPFVQLDSTLSRQYDGSGLGLALVYRLAEMHGGSVSLQSVVGKGSRFTVSLPWEPAASPVPANATPERAEGDGSELPFTRSLTILLAEDNQANIDTISDYLLAAHQRVIVARNGAEAIERAREELPDIILMDIQMPGMNGLEATRRLRADAALRTIPIIALTALTMPGDAERCLTAGADVFLSKPVTMAHLTQVIQAHVLPEGAIR